MQMFGGPHGLSMSSQVQQQAFGRSASFRLEDQTKHGVSLNAQHGNDETLISQSMQLSEDDEESIAMLGQS